MQPRASRQIASGEVVIARGPRAFSDRTALFTAELDYKNDQRTGVLVEYDVTSKMFSNPADERTENYITGRFG